jgi:hypothetical protein
MHYNIFNLLLTIGFLISVRPSQAQDYYTVLIGSFVEVSPQDFAAARSLGFVYKQITAENIQQVYVGNYTDQAKATLVAGALRNQGFTNAQVISRPLRKNGPEEIVIQIATRFSNRSINWEDLRRAGDLNVTVEDERIKVMTGTFPNIATAQSILPNIRALGFSDAFVKSVPRDQLLPVTSLSTGIKEDLIPLQLNNEPLTSPKAETTVIPEENSQSGGRITTNTPPSVPRPQVPGAENNPPASPVVAATSSVTPPSAILAKGVTIPNIRGNIKRNSVTNLQRLLSSQGYYNSALDGLYGNGTNSAYQQMLTQDRNIQKYRLLIPFYATAVKASDPIMAWEEIQLLQAITRDISPSTPEQLQIAENQRAQLYLRNTPLPIDQGTVLEGWQQNRWQQIEQWAAQDAFLLETAKSLSFAYFQSLVRLEDFYMDKGFDAVPARHLAIATIKTITGSSFERF